MNDFATFIAELAGIASEPAMWLSSAVAIMILRMASSRARDRTLN